MFNVKTSYDLHVENVQLLLEDEIGLLLLEKKSLEEKVAKLKIEIGEKQGELVAEMKENHIKEAKLSDDYLVVLVPERTTSRVLPYNELHKQLHEVFECVYSDEYLKEVFTKKSTTKSHIRVVPIKKA